MKDICYILSLCLGTSHGGPCEDTLKSVPMSYEACMRNGESAMLYSPLVIGYACDIVDAQPLCSDEGEPPK